MGLKKKQAFTQLEHNYTIFSNLVLRQLKTLENLFQETESDVIRSISNQILQQEDLIDNFETKITEDIISTMVLYSPVASELRELMSLNRIITNLEKVSDLIVEITIQANSILDFTLYNQYSEVCIDMLGQANELIEKSLFSFVNDDNDYAVWTIKQQTTVKNQYQSIITDIISNKLSHLSSQTELQTYISVLNILSILHKISEKSANISESAIFASLGKDIRHIETHLL